MADVKQFIESAIKELGDLIADAGEDSTTETRVLKRLDLVIKTNLKILETLDQQKRV